MASYGNRTTDNAFSADSGENLITKAISDIETKTEWHVTDRDKFKNLAGVYYDSKKVGSFFVEVTNSQGVRGVLKLQLRPLDFDEGSIIREVGPQIRTTKIRLPQLFGDNRWNKGDGYGYLIFEDLSHLPKIWSSIPPTEEDYQRHKKFLKEFFNGVLPLRSSIPKPKGNQLELARESFEHYRKVAQHSSHHHITPDEIQDFKLKYFGVLEKTAFEDLHFTHGHLSGLDILFNKKEEQYVLLGNLYWKWRPMYWELTFPTWNSIMHVRDKNFTFNDFLAIVNRWSALGSTELYDHDPTTNQQYWINLLAFAMNTIMLDLGASEWEEEEKPAKQNLLERWKEFFEWIIENKF